MDMCTPTLLDYWNFGCAHFTLSLPPLFLPSLTPGVILLPSFPRPLFLLRSHSLTVSPPVSLSYTHSHAPALSLISPLHSLAFSLSLSVPFLSLLSLVYTLSKSKVSAPYSFCVCCGRGGAGLDKSMADLLLGL